MTSKRSFSDLSTLDRVVHEAARLAVLTALSACRSAQFQYLLALTRLTPGKPVAPSLEARGAQLGDGGKEF